MGKAVATEAGGDVALLVGFVEEKEASLVGLVGRGSGHVD